jgi:hypothetical protein
MRAQISVFRKIDLLGRGEFDGEIIKMREAKRKNEG